MRPIRRVITENPEVIPLNHYGKVGCGVYRSGGTIKTLADKDDITTVIDTLSGGNLAYAADAILVENGVSETVVISQYGS